MHEAHARMKALHHLLTAGSVHGTPRCAYPPRHLWGDSGQHRETPRDARRFLPERLLRWRGSAR